MFYRSKHLFCIATLLSATLSHGMAAGKKRPAPKRTATQHCQARQRSQNFTFIEEDPENSESDSEDETREFEISIDQGKIEYSFYPDDKSGHIEHLFIHKNERRKGYGSLLLKGALKHLEDELKCDKITLVASPENPYYKEKLVAFYWKHGFNLAENEKWINIKTDSPHPAIDMVKKIVKNSSC